MTTLHNGYRTSEPIETNTRTWDDTRTARIERRMTKIAEGQVAILRDAVVDYIGNELSRCMMTSKR